MPRKRIAIRNHSAEANLFARRTLLTFLGVLVLLLILFTNVYNLQVNSYQKYKTRSNDNRIKVLPVAPNRGLIYDRNGVLLAENKPIYSLEFIPEQVKNAEQTLTDLGQFIEISNEQRTKALKYLKVKRRFNPIEVKSRLSEQEVAQFYVQQHKFPGVFIEARLKRFYPFADLATHSVGYVARINRQDAIKLEEQEKAENYAATRNIGKLGLERYYEDILHGKIGHQEVEVNNQGRILRTLSFSPPTPGKDLKLTLDIELQMIAKRALADRRGAVVAIDPRDGSVLAMYSNPSYNPNLFVHGISSKEYKKLLSTDRPLLNRTTQGQYPPASTMKPFLGLTGLEKGVITPKTKVWDPGWYKLKDVERKFRDHKKWGHGWVNLELAMEQSCNTYFYHLAHKLGIDNISEVIGQFGFGEKTGVDILEEYDAVLPSRHWKRIRHNQPWYQGDTVNVGIGQGYWVVTPLQLAQATATLVNKGQIHPPHLLKATQSTKRVLGDESQFIIETEQRELESLAPITLEKPDSWDIILNTMYQTVQDEHGTGYKAFKGANYHAAGKSGTAEIIGMKEDTKYEAEEIEEKYRDNAMFIAFAPYHAPEIVVAVAIENVAKGGGGSNAGPVARQIMDQYFGNRTFTAQHPRANQQANNNN
jgi:penicillin-binding protein 2